MAADFVKDHVPGFRVEGNFHVRQCLAERARGVRWNHSVSSPQIEIARAVDGAGRKPGGAMGVEGPEGYLKKRPDALRPQEPIDCVAPFGRDERKKGKVGLPTRRMVDAETSPLQEQGAKEEEEVARGYKEAPTGTRGRNQDDSPSSSPTGRKLLCGEKNKKTAHRMADEDGRCGRLFEEIEEILEVISDPQTGQNGFALPAQAVLRQLVGQYPPAQFPKETGDPSPKAEPSPHPMDKNDWRPFAPVRLQMWGFDRISHSGGRAHFGWVTISPETPLPEAGGIVAAPGRSRSSKITQEKRAESKPST